MRGRDGRRLKVTVWMREECTWEWESSLALCARRDPHSGSGAQGKDVKRADVSTYT